MTDAIVENKTDNAEIIIQYENNVISAFACTCDDNTEKEFTRLFFEMINKECGENFTSLNDVPYYIADWCTRILDDFDYHITCIISDMWSRMDLKNCRKADTELSIQYDVFIFGITLAYIILNMRKEGKLTFDKEQKICLNTITLT